MTLQVRNSSLSSLLNGQRQAIMAIRAPYSQFRHCTPSGWSTARAFRDQLPGSLEEPLNLLPVLPILGALACLSVGTFEAKRLPPPSGKQCGILEQNKAMRVRPLHLGLGRVTSATFGLLYLCLFSGG